MATPLPASLRHVIARDLRAGAGSTGNALELLGAYDADPDPEVKTEAAINYYRSRSALGLVPSDEVASLVEAALRSGILSEGSRQAAVAALVELGQLRELAGRFGRYGERPLLAPHVRSYRPNPTLLRALLEHWGDVRRAVEDGIAALSGREESIWPILATVADEYPCVRSELLDYFSEHPEEFRSPEVLYFIARANPRSSLLLRACLNHVRTKSRFAGNPPTVLLVAAELLGRDFAMEPEVLGQITEGTPDEELTEAQLLALARGWPAHDSLDVTYRRALRGERRVSHALMVRLKCLRGTTEEVKSFIGQVIEDPDPRYDPVYRTPLESRIARDYSLSDRLFAGLSSSPTPSAKCSIPKLLAASRGISDELRTWCRDEIAIQSKRPIAEVGLDLLAGEPSSVRIALLDVLR